MIKLRKAILNELKDVLTIIQDGQSFLKSQGLDQWQNGYPNETSITNDINNGNCYVLIDNEKIVATAAIIYDKDPNYDIIYEGKWITDLPYVVIHRIATKQEYRNKGYASKIIELTKKDMENKNIHSLRIDTHEYNYPMQKMLSKNGFIKCGTIYLNGIIDQVNKRFAYEYVATKK